MVVDILNLAPGHPVDLPDLDALPAREAEVTRRWARPVDQAVALAFGADRLGLAFAAGYRAALRRLVPGVGAASLCVTEGTGAHPRDIHTRLDMEGGAVRLHGEKAWATLAGAAEVLLVGASAGEVDGRKVLRVVRVPADAPGVYRTPMPPAPFTPEVPHLRIRFDGVSLPAEAVLPGDGWTTWIRPFRTVEDIHVSAAVAAWLFRTGHAQGWPDAALTELAALLVGLDGLAEADPAEAGVHLALAGLLDGLARSAAAVAEHWDPTDVDGRGRWERDRPLLGVAARARAERRSRAWARLGPGNPPPAPPG